MTEIELQVEPCTAAAVIPTSSFERLAVKEGDIVTFIVNPTAVIVAK